MIRFVCFRACRMSIKRTDFGQFSDRACVRTVRLFGSVYYKTVRDYDESYASLLNFEKRQTTQFETTIKLYRKRTYSKALNKYYTNLSSQTSVSAVYIVNVRKLTNNKFYALGRINLKNQII